jgi:hypothetical protein
MAGNTTPTYQAISPFLKLYNTGTSGIPLNEVTIRYWYTVDGNPAQNYWCDYASVGNANVTGRFVQLTVPRPGADGYLEIGFTANAGVLAPGANTGIIQNRFSKIDWSNYNQADDYSFNPAMTQYADWTKVTVYRNGTLVWGIEP